MAMEHILLIEDDQRLAQMVCDYLQQFGFVLTHALNGQLGLQKLHDAQHLAQPAPFVILD